MTRYSPKRAACAACFPSREVGSTRIYAGAHQFGARRGACGTNKKGAPIPWGDIPARPFLGVSDADKKTIQ